MNKHKPAFGCLPYLLLFIIIISCMTGIIKSNDPDNDFIEAISLYYDGNFTGSLNKLRAIVATNPDDDKARLNLVHLLREEGRFDEAIEHLNTLIKKDPANQNYHETLATLLYLAGHPEAVLQVSGLGESAQSLYWQGLAQADLGNDDSAINLLEMSLAKESFHPIAYYQLANLYLKRNEFEKAQSLYKRALEQEPSLTAAYYPLALCYIAQEKYAAAYSLLTRAESCLPWNPLIKEKLQALIKEHPELVEKQRQEMEQKRTVSVPPKVKPILENRESIPIIRIGLAEKIEQVYVKTGGNFILSERKTGRKVSGAPQTVLLIRHTAGGIEVVNAQNRILMKSPSSVILSYPNNEDTSIIFNLEFERGTYWWAGREDRCFRGQIEFLPFKNHFTIINHINIEEYLYAVLPAEMSHSWPKEALAAQAVAARTYTLANIGRYESRGFDLMGSVVSAAYPGVKKEASSTTAAVDATRGEILTYKDKPAATFYSANTGGYTESSKDVWGFHAPYLQAVPDKMIPIREIPLSPEQLTAWLQERPPSYSSTPGYFARNAYRWKIWVSRKELDARLNMGDRLGRIISIKTAGRGLSGRVKKVLIKGTEGETTLQGDIMRSKLGGLRSNLFMVQPKMGKDGLPEFFIFTGAGWGHGVGMCQSGAAGMASAGYTYKDILQHYYPGTVLTKRY